MKLKDALTNWATAHKLAAENPNLIFSAKGEAEATKVADICAQRMKDCHNADKELYRHMWDKKLPDKVTYYLEALIEVQSKWCECHFQNNPAFIHDACHLRFSIACNLRDELIEDILSGAVYRVYKPESCHNCGSSKFGEYRYDGLEECNNCGWLMTEQDAYLAKLKTYA